MGLAGPKLNNKSAIGKIWHVPDKPKGKTRADRLINWIESLPITSGMLAGKPFTLRPWQKKELRAIYRTDKQGRRVVRQALFTIPRKNGKTQLAAALALAHLCGPEAEPRGQVYSAAADRHQAGLIYNEMKAIINATDLQRRVIIRDFNKHLEDIKTGGEYYALSHDSKTKHGLSASFIVYDELAQAPNRELYDVLNTSGGARAEPLFFIISTQSPDEHSAMTELVNYGLDIKKGIKSDPTFHAVIYTAPEDADPWSEKVWHACNPALGDFRSLEEMRAEAVKAQHIPSREATFRLLYLNQRVNVESRFIAMADWNACGGPVDVEALKGRTCYGALDLSSVSDLTALVLVFPPAYDEVAYQVVPFLWLPAHDIAEKARRDRVPYEVWNKQGFLQLTPGNRIDYNAVMDKMAQCKADFDLQILAFDRWGADKLVPDLCERFDFTADHTEYERYGKALLFACGQGFADLSPPTKELLSMILGREIAHGGHPVLKWMANNVIVETDAAGNVKPNKSKSIQRIDGIVALIMALKVAKKFGNESGGSIYERRARAGDGPIVRGV